MAIDANNNNKQQQQQKTTTTVQCRILIPQVILFSLTPLRACQEQQEKSIIIGRERGGECQKSFPPSNFLDAEASLRSYW